MSRDAQKTLFHPFETGELEVPGADANVLFLNAEPGFRLPDGFAARLSLVQGFRPFFRALEASGHDVAPAVGTAGHDMALVLCGRHRGRNEMDVAEAVERVAAGGLVLVAGSKDEGIGSLRKRIAGLVDVDGQAPKHHGLAFWFRRPHHVAEILSALRSEIPAALIEGRFRAAPGMFSHDRIDAGSRLLAEQLPGGLSGSVADFCAGWGYLAAEIAGRFPAVKALDLYEADFESLEASKHNIAGIAPALPLRFFWRDLLSEPVADRYDAIVMNPPFHQGRAAEPGIGRQLIRAAAKALKKGGRLVMVANRQLPYEETVGTEFADWQEAARDDAFKVLTARR